MKASDVGTALVKLNSNLQNCFRAGFAGFGAHGLLTGARIKKRDETSQLHLALKICSRVNLTKWPTLAVSF